MSEPLEQVRSLVGRGEYLGAHDRAMELLALDPTDRAAQFFCVLSLARAGATQRATERLIEFGLDAPQLSGGATELDIDIAALGARLDKDRALAASGEERVELAAASAQRYEELYRSVGGVYPGINAATMWRVAGFATRSELLAAQVLEAAAADVEAEGESAYWSAATAAEAALLLGRSETAAQHLERAGGLDASNLAARASTCRQLDLVCHLVGIPSTILAPIRNAGVVHFCGHRMESAGGPGRFTPEHEPFVAARIGELLDTIGVGAGFGSLASGADIIAAEALLDRGAELHVWLPFDDESFLEESVADSGPEWVERFHGCRERADSVSYASATRSLDPEVLFDYCSRLAMGSAMIRAGFLHTGAHQIAVWDGGAARARAGTAVDVDRWAATGNPQHLIAPADAEGHAASSRHGGADEPSAPVVRSIRALVFADVAGFSRLDDAQVARYDAEVLTELAAVIDGFGDAVELRETWGDGIYLVLRDVGVAARCALALQDVMDRIDLDDLGLGVLRGLRVGAHVGPVLVGWDPIARRARYSGGHVTRAARIEPRTPEGAVYVTQQFAAFAMLDAAADFTCQYVGQIAAAKDYGDLPMYVLARR